MLERLWDDNSWFNNSTHHVRYMFGQYREFIYRIYENKLMDEPPSGSYKALDEVILWFVYRQYIRAFPFFRVFYTLITNLVERDHKPEDRAVTIPKYTSVNSTNYWDSFLEDEFLQAILPNSPSLSTIVSFFEYTLIEVPLLVYNNVLKSFFNIIINCPQSFKNYPYWTPKPNERISPVPIAIYKRVYDYGQKVKHYFVERDLVIVENRRIPNMDLGYTHLIDIDDFTPILKYVVKIPL